MQGMHPRRGGTGPRRLRSRARSIAPPVRRCAYARAGGSVSGEECQAMKGTQRTIERPLAAIAAALREGAVSAEALARECIEQHEATEAKGIAPPLHTYKLWDPPTTLAQPRAADDAFA